MCMCACVKAKKKKKKKMSSLSDVNNLLHLTFCDHALQPNDVGMVKLAHDGRLAQEVPPLSIHVAALQRLDRHGDLLLARRPQAAAAHLTKLTCRARTRPSQTYTNSPPGGSVAAPI